MMDLMSNVGSPNQTFTNHLRMASFDIPPPLNYLVFILGMLLYIFSLFCNLTILVLIITQRSLHKPMFYILFSLPLNDLIGITAFLPRLLGDIVTQTNFAYYPTCVLQAFLLHMYGGAVLFVLAAMSIDRYFAICKPLQYHSLMTPCTLRTLISLAWGFDFALLLAMFGLQARVKNMCRDTMHNVYCENVSLLLLSCGDDLTINNIYGIAITALFQIVSLVIQLFSYFNIFVVCVMNRQSHTIRKAVNTCMAQVVTFLLFEFLVTFTVAAHRSQSLSPNARRFCGMLVWLLLPVLNPLIYGMNTKDIKNTFLSVIKRNKQIAIM